MAQSTRIGEVGITLAFVPICIPIRGRHRNFPRYLYHSIPKPNGNSGGQMVLVAALHMQIVLEIRAVRMPNHTEVG
jgi:hypothetical protein